MNPTIIALILGQLIPLGIRMYASLQPMTEEEQKLWIDKLQNDIATLLPKLGEITQDEEGRYK